MSHKCHFVDYYAEERGETVIEVDEGFVAYKIYDNPGVGEKEIMICDLYVAPEHRRKGIAQGLADAVSKVGRDNNCTHISCYVQHVNDKRGRIRTSHKVRIFGEYGFKIHSMNDVQILMYKDL